ncbi:MAG: glutaredoxin domain-containing protein [Pseudomonadota bacterium]
MSDAFRLFWQPGCTSCLRTKEFLGERGIPFESINVVEAPDAIADLQRLGFRSVPVLARGDVAIACQDLEEIAAFLEVDYKATRLDVPALVERLDRLLEAAGRFTHQFSNEELSRHFVGRERPFRDLAFHIYMIPAGFLAATRGGRLEMAHFLETPPADKRSADAIVGFGESVRENLAAWFEQCRDNLPDEVDTYYGRRSLVTVLERTTWHAAQHCRQLEAVLRLFGHEPDGPLGDAELGDLPLPRHVFDDEMALATAD